MQKRDLRKVERWQELAWQLYRKFYGNRCVSCSKPVAMKDAAMYQMEGLDDVILVHKGECEK